MSYEDDLNKPLGKQHRNQPGKTAGRSSGLLLPITAATSFGALALAALVYFQDPPATPVTAENQVAELTPPDEAAETADNTTEPEEPPKQRRELDPDAEPIAPVPATGELTEPKPRPKPTAEEIAARKRQNLPFKPDPDLSEEGATGIIPKRSPDGLRPLDVYARKPQTEGNFGVARVVLIIGGLGISQTSTQSAIAKLPPDVTLAFAPYGNSLSRWMQAARKAGHELLLQIPMEPFGYPQNNPGVHTLTSDATLDENLANLHWSMSRITNYVGVMNYLGGKLLSDPVGLSPIFSELAERGLMFVDDGTVPSSSSETVSKQALLPFAKASIQIDAVKTRAAMAEQLNKLADEAKKTGLAVGVGSAFPETIGMVAEFIRKARSLGIEITPVSAVASRPEEG